MKRLALIIGIIITTFAIGCFCKAWAEDFLCTYKPGSLTCVKYEAPPVPTPSPTPTPTPAPPTQPPPTASPTPPPPSTPPSTCPTKVTANAFCTAANQAKPGDCVQCVSGTITEKCWLDRSGTPDKLITYIFDPGTLIKMGVWNQDAQLRVNGSYIDIVTPTVEETYAFKIYGDRVSLRGAKIGNMRYSCLDALGSYVSVIGSEVYWCGHGKNGQRYSGNNSGKQLHGIYFNPLGKNQVGGVVKDSHIHHISGRGIQAYTDQGGTVSGSYTNNLFDHIAYGIIGWGIMRDSVISGNTFILKDYPSTDSTETCVGGYYSRNLTIAGNTCKTNWRGNMCSGFFENHGGVSAVNCLNNKFE